jgi:hypothetical protein
MSKQKVTENDVFLIVFCIIPVYYSYTAHFLQHTVFLLLNKTVVMY